MLNELQPLSRPYSWCATWKQWQPVGAGATGKVAAGATTAVPIHGIRSPLMAAGADGNQRGHATSGRGSDVGGHHGSVKRILVIDDNPGIHQDFRKILQPKTYPDDDALLADEQDIFGAAEAGADSDVAFEVDTALQGQEGLLMVREALAAERPYSVAFVDIRMPPGWNGIETAAHIWRADPLIQIVICTAYSDYSRADMVRELGYSQRLVVLKKPFDTVEVHQLACALTEKWTLLRERDQSDNAAGRGANSGADTPETGPPLAPEQMSAVKVSRAIGRLAAGIWREVKGPLDTVFDALGRSQDEIRELGDETGRSRIAGLRHDVATAARSAGYIHQVLADLEAIVRSTGNTSIGSDLSRVFATVIAGLDTDIAALVHVRQDAPVSPSLWVRADEEVLLLLFAKLLRYAAQDMPEGYHRAGVIQVHIRPDQDELLAIEIAHPSADQDTRTSDDSCRRSLGDVSDTNLEICRSIVDALGGELTMEFTADAESVIRLTLPRLA